MGVKRLWWERGKGERDLRKAESIRCSRQSRNLARRNGRDRRGFRVTLWVRARRGDTDRGRERGRQRDGGSGEGQEGGCSILWSVTGQAEERRKRE